MADEKITQLDAHGAFADSDLVEIVDDPSGTPDNEKATVGALLDYAAGRTVRQVPYASVAAASAAGLLTVVSDAPYLARDSGAAQIYYGPVWKATPPASFSWAWVNQGSAVLTENGSSHIEGVSDVTRNSRIRVKSHTAPKAYRALMISDVPNNNGTTIFAFGGLCFRESSTGKMVQLSALIGTTNAFEADRMTNETTFSAQIGTTVVRGLYGGLPVWLEIEDNNTSIFFRYSFDGVYFRLVTSESRTAFLAGGPNQVGFYTCALGSPGAHGVTWLAWNEV